MIGPQKRRNNHPPIGHTLSIDRQNPYAHGLRALFPFFNPAQHCRNLAHPSRPDPAMFDANPGLFHQKTSMGMAIGPNQASPGDNDIIENCMPDVNVIRGTLAVRYEVHCETSTQIQVFSLSSVGQSDGVHLIHDGYAGRKARFAYKYDYTYPNIRPGPLTGNDGWHILVGTFEFLSTTVSLNAWLKDSSGIYTDSGTPSALVWDTPPVQVDVGYSGDAANYARVIDARYWDYILPDSMCEALLDSAVYWDLYEIPTYRFISIPADVGAVGLPSRRATARGIMRGVGRGVG